jgi:hypothetical protein
MSCFFAGDFLKLEADLLPDTAQLFCLAGSLFYSHGAAPLFGPCSLGDNDDGKKPSAFLTIPDLFGHPVNVIRNFRNQNNIGSGRYPHIESYPTGISTHHFYNHNPLVCLGSGMQPVAAFGGKMNRCIESECYDGLIQIIVDCFRHTDDLKSFLIKNMRNLH